MCAKNSPCLASRSFAQSKATHFSSTVWSRWSPHVKKCCAKKNRIGSLRNRFTAYSRGCGCRNSTLGSSVDKKAVQANANGSETADQRTSQRQGHPKRQRHTLSCKTKTKNIMEDKQANFAYFNSSKTSGSFSMMGPCPFSVVSPCQKKYSESIYEKKASWSTTSEYYEESGVFSGTVHVRFQRMVHFHHLKISRNSSSPSALTYV